MRRIDFKSGLDMAEDFYAALEFSPDKNVEVDVVSASADPYSVVATSDLDDVAARLAAARAEAVAEHVRQQDEEAQRESDEDELVWDEIKATPIEQIESELRDAGCDTDNLTKQTRMVVRLSLVTCGKCLRIMNSVTVPRRAWSPADLRKISRTLGSK